MKELTLSQYLSQNEKRAEEIRDGQAKSRTKLIRFIVIFVVALVLGIALSFVAKWGVSTLKYNKLTAAANSQDTAAVQSVANDLRLLSFKDATLVYENAFLGNSNQSIIAQRGKICTIDGIKYQAVNGKLERVDNGKTSTLLEKEVSYINRYGKSVLFRDDATNQVCVLENGQEKVLISKAKAGQIMTKGNTVYYTDQNDGNALYQYDGKTSSKVYTGNCSEFALIGNYILVRTANNYLVLLDSAGVTKEILHGVQYFLTTDRIYAYSNGVVFTIDFTFRNAKKVCEGKGVPLYIGSNGIYLQNESKIVLLKDDIESTIAENVLVCKGIYEQGGNKVVINTVSIGENGKEDVYKEYSVGAAK